MGILAAALVLAIEDAQEMFQRNTYCTCMCMCMRVGGVDQIPRVFMLLAAFAPGETMEGEWLFSHTSCENDER